MSEPDAKWIRKHTSHLIDHLEALVDSGMLATMRGSSLRLWIALWRHANHTDGSDVFPSLPTLEGETGLKKSAVSDGLKQLRELRLVQVTEEGYPGRRGRSTRRRMLVADLDMLPEDAEPRKPKGNVTRDEKPDNALIKQLVPTLTLRNTFTLWHRIGGESVRDLLHVARFYPDEESRRGFLRRAFGRTKSLNRCAKLREDIADWRAHRRALPPIRSRRRRR